ncbi:uncharacterized protein MELLADRAFT_56582 [Melampsora larici-populina 98AG31]|uniref:Uncharacterized protein n=1 Tax=Melampsora larici-populina (strain 98AG31 / pathotype 3-4-7) TaxID=747676 RepID=F4RS76_MELLP|nr:uncharacterized protein MELLADRAFT_56582 [Melampsora larici-populina 98AG31]EGG04827.1 hypothetical protein MELLADRAFT_56582 [Melampsora larici-populina 98AG31]
MAACGIFPTIGTITKEDEEELPEDQVAEHDLDDLDDSQPQEAIKEAAAPINDEDDWDLADAEDDVIPAVVLEAEVAPTHRRAANDVDFTLRKIDFIIRRITRSAAWRK